MFISLLCAGHSGCANKGAGNSKLPGMMPEEQQQQQKAQLKDSQPNLTPAHSALSCRYNAHTTSYYYSARNTPTTSTTPTRLHHLPVQVIERVSAHLPQPAPSAAVFVGGLPTADDEKRLRR